MADDYSFQIYDKEVSHLAKYPQVGENPIYPALGLVGEAGEVAEKIKKLWRNELKTRGADYSPEQRTEIVKELGDVLWYVAALAREVGSHIEEVAKTNSIKLNSRGVRGVINSAGDNR
jgi:NTP pyrophosphatase (non-canonical NTP hydrolase)